MCLVGLPPNGVQVDSFKIVASRRALLGSMIGGIKETQEMLDYCGEHNIGACVRKEQNLFV